MSASAFILSAALFGASAHGEPGRSPERPTSSTLPAALSDSGQLGSTNLILRPDAALVTGEPARTPDVIYVPTPQPVVDKMLELAKPKKTELVYDLGCGDGRIVVAAAKRFGTKAIGFDIDPRRVEEARENVRKNKVEHLVTIEERDIFTLDLSPAGVVTLYLLPELNVKLIPQLEKLKPGARIVSHDFDMRGVTPARVVKLRPTGRDREHIVYLWSAPLVRGGPASVEEHADDPFGLNF